MKGTKLGDIRSHDACAFFSLVPLVFPVLAPPCHRPRLECIAKGDTKTRNDPNEFENETSRTAAHSYRERHRAGVVGSAVAAAGVDVVMGEKRAKTREKDSGTIPERPGWPLSGTKRPGPTTWPACRMSFARFRNKKTPPNERTRSKRFAVLFFSLFLFFLFLSDSRRRQPLFAPSSSDARAFPPCLCRVTLVMAPLCRRVPLPHWPARLVDALLAPGPVPGLVLFGTARQSRSRLAPVPSRLAQGIARIRDKLSWSGDLVHSLVRPVFLVSLRTSYKYITAIYHHLIGASAVVLEMPQRKIKNKLEKTGGGMMPG